MVNDTELEELTFELLISRIYHSINKIKQQELTNRYNIAPRQLYVLHIINSLKSKATVNEVASLVDRDPHVVGRIVALLEKEGLITRSKKSPKSRTMKLQLTREGIKMIKISPNSKSINIILSNIPKNDFRHLESNLNTICVKLKEYSPGLQKGGIC